LLGSKPIRLVLAFALPPPLANIKSENVSQYVRWIIDTSTHI